MMRTSLAEQTRRRGMGWMNSPMLAYRIPRLALAVVAALLLLGGGTGAMADEVESGVDRPGRDYKSFEMEPTIAGFSPCQSRCENDGNCKAWTFVKAGVQGSKARCYLKNAVPNASRNNCCVSGVVNRTQPQTQPQLDPLEVADRNPTGKSIEQCQQAFQRNSVRCLQRFGATVSKFACDAEMQQIMGTCISLAAANAGGGTTSGGAGGDVPAEWAETLSLHNAKRAMHGTPALAWSSSLAAEAQEWADQCSLSHSGFNGFGENLYWGGSATGKAAVESWYAEVTRYDRNDPITSFNAGETARSKEVRHFTQVVWKATTTLGCGIQQCGGRKFVVCRYKPQGNWNANDPGVLEEMVPASNG